MSNELELNKDRADADRYYKLFADKVGKLNDDERILFIHIGNFDVLDRFIQSNPNCSYYIIDQRLNGPWFEMNWDCKFIPSYEDKSIVEKLESLDMKFDKIIMNPPYSKNLHLKILAKAIEHLNENGTCVNLSPIRWLQDPLAKYKKNTDFKKFEDSVAKHIESLDVIDTKMAVDIFKAGILMNLGIFKCTQYSFDNYKKFNENKILDKIITNSKHLADVVELNRRDGIRWTMRDIQPMTAQGGAEGTYGWQRRFCIYNTKRSTIYVDGKKDGVDWTRFNSGIKTDEGSPMPHSIKFDSMKEAVNFENSLKTTFYHYCVFMMKQDQHTPWIGLPWMGDCINPRTGKKGYENEWTDEDFYKYFGITEEEQKLIEETMEKYK